MLQNAYKIEIHALKLCISSRMHFGVVYEPKFPLMKQNCQYRISKTNNMIKIETFFFFFFQHRCIICVLYHRVNQLPS